jgi:hypothetical protein
MTLIEEGMSIDISPLPENADLSSIDNFESKSYVTSAKFWHSEKDSSPMTSTEEGM